MPGGALVPWLSVAVILFLLSNATTAELLAVGGALAVFAALYVLRRRTLTGGRGDPAAPAEAPGRDVGV